MAKLVICRIANPVTEADDALQDFLDLRQSADSAQLATLDADDLPAASHAPVIWLEEGVYLYLSDLAAHAQNLRRNPALGLVLVGADNGNPFARQRITLQCSAELVSRQDHRFGPVMSEFRHNFGKVMELLEPLGDFNLFLARIERGGFVRGFGQAYVFEGPDPRQLHAVDPRAEPGAGKD